VEILDSYHIILVSKEEGKKKHFMPLSPESVKDQHRK